MRFRNPFRREECPKHDMEPVIFPPPEFKLLAIPREGEEGKGQIWRTTIMVCRTCWRVEARHQRHTKDKVYLRQTGLNTSDCYRRPSRLEYHENLAGLGGFFD